MQNSMVLPIDILPPEDKDIPFIRDSWLKSYRDSEWVAGIPSDIFYRSHGAIVGELLYNSIIKTARWSKDHNQIYGWIAAEKYKDALVIHYVYVKSAFRKMGIGRTLFFSLEDIKTQDLLCTHRTWTHKWLSKKINIKYNPYLLMGG